MNIEYGHPVLAWQPGPWELLIVLFVVLLLFGSKKLPALSRSMGKSISEFKKGKEEVAKELKKTTSEDSGVEDSGVEDSGDENSGDENSSSSES